MPGIYYAFVLTALVAIAIFGPLIHKLRLPANERLLWLAAILVLPLQPNGVNPEKGGYDSHYQAHGLVFATRYYALVADATLQGELKRTIDMAFVWLVTCIAPDGTVNTAGNTRTAGQEATRSGKVKGVEYKYVYRSLGYWAAITGDPALQDAAKKVADAEARVK
jgi:hypothetical protein